MYDFAHLIAADEICPSFAFSFKPVCTENFIRIDWSKESPNVSAQ